MTPKKILKMKSVSNPDPKVQAIFNMTSAKPQMTGTGPLSYTCEKCDAVLIRDIHYQQVEDGVIVIKCFTCNTFNEIPTSHHTH